MKTILGLLVLLQFITIVSFAQGVEKDCQKCGQRVILCWDLNIDTSKPANTEDSIVWKQLHNASDGYIGNMMGRGNGGCLSFITACLRSGAEPWKNPCPYNGQSETNTYNTDYEMLGDISGSEGAYVLRLTLVTVKRETVVSVTKKFEKASDAKWYGSLAALELGGSATGSRNLYDVIHEFELKKRDAAQGIKYNKVALNATVKFKSEERNVRINNRLPIEIELKDCDDVPLKSALVELQVAKGRFEKNNVETNEKGIAHAVYLAPNEVGIADVKVEYKYRHPSEKLGYTSDNTEIFITKPVTYLTGKINVMYSEKVSTKDDNDKVVRTVKTDTGYETMLTFKIDRMRISMMEDPKFRESQAGKNPVLGGTSFYQERDYSKGNTPFLNIRNDIQVKINSKTEGFRKFNKEDWDVIHTFETEAVNRFQAVRISFSPEQPKTGLTSSGVQLPYILTITADLINENLSNRDYNKTPDGKSQTWNGLTKKMEDNPPPFQFGIPYETFFSSANGDENVTYTPMKVDATALNKFLLNPKGSRNFHLTGSAVKHEDNQDTEQQISVELNLLPKE